MSSLLLFLRPACSQSRSVCLSFRGSPRMSGRISGRVNGFSTPSRTVSLHRAHSACNSSTDAPRRSRLPGIRCPSVSRARFSGKSSYDSPAAMPQTTQVLPSLSKTRRRTLSDGASFFGLDRPNPGCHPLASRRYSSCPREPSSLAEGICHPSRCRRTRKRRLRCSAAFGRSSSPRAARSCRIVILSPGTQLKASHAASFCSSPNGRLAPGASLSCHQRVPSGT